MTPRCIRPAQIARFTRGDRKNRRGFGRRRGKSHRPRSGPTGRRRRSGAVTLHPRKYAGEPAEKKLEQIAAAPARPISCWSATRMRSPGPSTCAAHDVAHTPIALGFALIPREGKPRAFHRTGASFRQKIARSARRTGRTLRRPPTCPDAPRPSSGRDRYALQYDAATAPSALVHAFSDAGGKLGARRRSHRSDEGDEERGRTGRRPRRASARRRRHGALPVLVRRPCGEGQADRDRGGAGVGNLSARQRRIEATFPSRPFPPSARMPPCRITGSPKNQCSTIGKGVYLVDSGGQYFDGTTDVTRTVAVGRAEKFRAPRQYAGAQGPYRHRPRRFSARNQRRATRLPRAPAFVGGGPGFRPRRRPWRRLLSLGA